MAALEDNLGELQAEYKKGQEEERARRQELEDNYNSYKALFHKNSPSKVVNGRINYFGESNHDSPAKTDDSCADS